MFSWLYDTRGKTTLFSASFCHAIVPVLCCCVALLPTKFHWCCRVIRHYFVLRHPILFFMSVAFLLYFGLVSSVLLSVFCPRLSGHFLLPAFCPLSRSVPLCFCFAPKKQHLVSYLFFPPPLFSVALFILFFAEKKTQSEVATKQAEADRLTAEIGSHEARSQGGGGASLRGEHQALEKAVAVLRRERKNLQQDLEISNMNPKEVGEWLYYILSPDVYKTRRVRSR